MWLPLSEARNTMLLVIILGNALRRMRHDDNPVLEWCLGNVVGKADRRGNLYPTKQRPDQKIDAAVAVMMALGRAMTEDENTGIDGFLSNPLIL
jgi:phage terminase large subunit-like protein